MVKAVLLTASGSGMGAASARELAAQGWRVAVMSSSGKGEALGQELGGVGITGNVFELADLQRAVDATLAAFGRIDAVVNSAPHPPKPATPGDLLGITDTDWHKGLDTILTPVVRIARLVVPQMQTQGGGAIVNISTAVTFEPDITFPVSGPMRAALAGFTKLFADKYAADNIRMNNVLPGFIDSLPEKEERRAKIPMNRYGKSEEIAKTVAFLCGDGGAYITGQNLRVDGGLTRHV
jgi:NAD(P)-dependent dehydrogenase (short-subunit alcohol dehydrogenase family)